MDISLRNFKELPRFLIAGGLNTALTYAIYLIVLFKFDYQIAYAVSYVIGILFSYWLNLRYVFKQEGSIKKIAIYPFVYVIQYLIGAGLLWIFVHALEINKVLAPLLVIVCVTPLTFFLIKKVLN